MCSSGIPNCKNKSFAPFPHLNSFLDENELDVNEGVLELMERHFSILDEEIRQYLEDFQKYCRFVNNSFGTSAWRSAFKIIYFKSSLLV